MERTIERVCIVTWRNDILCKVVSLAAGACWYCLHEHYAFWRNNVPLRSTHTCDCRTLYLSVFRRLQRFCSAGLLFECGFDAKCRNENVADRCGENHPDKHIIEEICPPLLMLLVDVETIFHYENEADQDLNVVSPWPRWQDRVARRVTPDRQRILRWRVEDIRWEYRTRT